MTVVANHGPISRASVARETGFSKQTTSEIIRALEARGWIQEVGRTTGNIGRTAVLYTVMPGAGYIIGVDLGGTKVTAAIADMTCSIVIEETQLTHVDGGHHVVAQITNFCRHLAKKADIAWEKILLCVIGTPGVVNPISGFVDFAPNLPGFDTLPLRESLSQSLNLDVVVENDVNLAVIGEHWQGAGQGVDNLAFIAVGTGVGQGLMIDGSLVRGACGGAGEIGYLPIGADPFGETAKTIGAFESMVGGNAILRRYKEKGGARETIKGVFEACQLGEETAQEVINETARLIALGVVATSALFDPEKVIFGGSIGEQEVLVEKIKAILPTCMRHPTPVEVSKLGNRAHIMGAVAVGLNKLHDTMFGSGQQNSEVLLPSVKTLSRRQELSL